MDVIGHSQNSNNFEAMLTYLFGDRLQGNTNIKFVSTNDPINMKWYSWESGPNAPQWGKFSAYSFNELIDIIDGYPELIARIKQIDGVPVDCPECPECLECPDCPPEQSEIKPFTKIRLSWEPSEDPESGVSHYQVRRNGMIIGSPKKTELTDWDIPNSFSYDVKAINNAGIESGYSIPLKVEYQTYQN